MKYNNKLISILLVFLLAHFGFPIKVLADQNDPNLCTFARQSNFYGPVISMFYDYGQNGLVRFYFTLDGSWGTVLGGINFYDSGCKSLGGTMHGSFNLSGVQHLAASAVPEPGNPDLYYFEIEDQDSGLSVGQIWATFTGDITASSILSLSIMQSANGQIWAASAGVRVKSVDAPKMPVLIVPGVLGTDIYKGSSLLWANIKMADGFDGFMDPMGFNPDLTPIDTSLTAGDVIRSRTILGLGTHYIDGLVTNLTAQGYAEGRDLFTFPYDWRFGVSENNVTALKGQIDYILNLTHADNVDVVAHSTGGLLVKKYVMEHPADHHISKAVFVGVPNLGAPLALKVLTEGDEMGVPGFDPREFKKIGHNMPVVYDLAPSQGYYNKIGSFFHLSAPWATDFNSQEQDMDFSGAENNLIDSGSLNPLGVEENKNLHTADFDNFDARSAGVDEYNIVGCASATLGGFTGVVNADGSWDFNLPKMVAGDNTVPFYSAQSISTDPGKTFFVPQIHHTDLLSKDGPSQEIINILSGSNLDTQGKVVTYAAVAQNPALCSLKGQYLNIFSPVEVSATDALGNLSTVASDGSIENNIPGADYEIWGTHKFVFLPTDAGQKYTVSLKGVGTGPATIKDESINNNEVTGAQVFADIPVTPKFSGGFVLPQNDSGTAAISVNSPSGGAPQMLAPSAIIGPDQSQDNLAPVASSSIVGILKQSGVYKDYATVVLSAADPVMPGQEDQSSGLLQIEYSLDNGPYQVYAEPITVSAAGSHVLYFFALDRAGNQSTEKSITFSVNSISNHKCCGPCC